VSTTRVLALDALVRIEDGAYANLDRKSVV